MTKSTHKYQVKARNQVYTRRFAEPWRFECKKGDEINNEFFLFVQAVFHIEKDHIPIRAGI